MNLRVAKKPLGFIPILLVSASAFTCMTLLYRQVTSITMPPVPVQVSVVQPDMVLISPDIVFVADAEFERMSLLVGTTVLYQGKGYMLLGLTGDTANPCQAMLIGLEGKVNCADIVTEPATTGAQPPAATNLDR